MALTRVIRARGLATMVALGIFVLPAEAAIEVRHSTDYWSDLTRAYQPCIAPNDASFEGVPACSPAVTSACEYSRGRVELEYHGDGVRVRARLSTVSGPAFCTSGDYRLDATLRVTAEDAACTGGTCTWIEVPFSFVINQPATGDNIGADFMLEDAFASQYGITKLLNAANIAIAGATIIAPDNLPIAATGIGNHDAERWSSGLSAYYPPCEMPDTQTTDAVPACSGPTWTTACDFTSGAVELVDSAGVPPMVPVVNETFETVSGTSPLCADGDYELVTTLRLTGNVCSYGPCTLVATQAVVPFTATGGVIRGSQALATSGLVGPFDSIEVYDTFVRDPFGGPFASPSVLTVHRIDRFRVRITFGETVTAADDRLKLAGKFTNKVPIDPTLEGATFVLKNRSALVYEATIPAARWEVLKPGLKWRYKDVTNTLAGVYAATIRNSSGHYKFNLKARGIDVLGADQSTADLIVNVGNTSGGRSQASRNAPCQVSSKRVKCRP